MPEPIKNKRPSSGRNIPIAYFSRSGATKQIADQINGLVDGTLFRIETLTPYPEDFKETVAKASDEKKAGSEPPLKTNVEGMVHFDTVFIGFPIWDMSLPAPIRTMLSNHDLSGKTIVPFCMHDGYGSGNSFGTLKQLCPRSHVLEGFECEGRKAGLSHNRLKNWLKGLALTQ